MTGHPKGMWPFKAPPKTPAQLRLDGWQNATTGLGTDRDKVMGGMFWTPIRLQDTELLAIFNGSDIGGRVATVPGKEMFRRGFSLKASADDDEYGADDFLSLKKAGEKLRAAKMFKQGMMWGNVFGGALLLIGAQDGKDVSEPLDESNIATVRFLNMVDRRFVTVRSYYSDPLSPNFGLPETYNVVSPVAGDSHGMRVVHESRAIRFDGVETDILTKQNLAGWSFSVYQRMYDHLRTFDMSFQSVANLMSDASQAVFKMQGLLDMLTTGGKDDLQNPHGVGRPHAVELQGRAARR